MKPILKYAGGKSRELGELAKYIPEYGGRYAEPFVGGGAMFFHLMPERGIINDINKRLISFHRDVAADCDGIMAELDGLAVTYAADREDFERDKAERPGERVYDGSESLYYIMRDQLNGRREKEFSDAAIYYFVNKTAYCGMTRYNAKGEYNVPFGRYKTFNASSLTHEHGELLRHTDIRLGSYRDVFDDLGTDDFAFLDPPYDCVFSSYGNKEYEGGFTEDDHRALAEDFRNLQCRAMMVIGETPLTASLYQGLVRGRYGKEYSVNIKNRFKSQATHIVVANYPC